MRFWQRLRRRKSDGRRSTTAAEASERSLSQLPAALRIIIEIPTLIDPLERQTQYAKPLAALLAEAEVGALVGQGNLLQKRFSGLKIVGSELVVETVVSRKALPLIRNFLLAQECPAETAVCLLMPQKRRLLVYRDEAEFLETKE